MVTIRLSRGGAKKRPFYHLTVTDSRNPRDGRFIEELGTYQPARGGQTFRVDLERANYWLSKGAQPSETVSSLLKRAAKAEAAAAA